jgi:hypothetical protein
MYFDLDGCCSILSALILFFFLEKNEHPDCYTNTSEQLAYGVLSIIFHVYYLNQGGQACIYFICLYVILLLV